MMRTKYTTLSLDGETSDMLAFLADKEHRSMASQVKHMTEKEIKTLGLKYKSKEAVA